MAVRRIAVPSGASSSSVEQPGTSSRDTLAYVSEKLSSASESTRRQLNNLPFVSGVWIKDVTVPTGANGQVVAHNLKATPQGYIITKASDDPRVYSTSASMNQSSLTFYNAGGSPVTIDVWVF